MKLNVVAYLIKQDISESDALKIENAPEKPTVSISISIPIDIEGTYYNFYIKNSLSAPQWSELFLGVGIDADIFESASIKGLLFVKIENRLLAFTFGHGRSMLDPSAIERGFGLRVTLNLGDSEKIKSIDKSTMEKTPLKTRTQSSKNTNINDFKFEFEQEILKSMRAVAVKKDKKDCPEIISGCDSVSINTNVSLDSFPVIAKRLLDAYSKKKYKDIYPWVDFIQSVSDIKLRDSLNTKMLKLIKNKEYDKVWISPPEIVDYDNFSEFVYKVQGDPLDINGELDLSEYIEKAKIEEKMKDEYKIRRLEKDSIEIRDNAHQPIKGWTVFNCMNCEVERRGKTYILNNGKWYGIDIDYSEGIKLFFDNLEKNSKKSKNKITFDPYEKSMKEEEYLRSVVASDKNFALLDQKMIHHENVKYKLEFCDLLYQELSSDNKAFIHVKKYVSSSTLSHLFAQASVATEFLINNPDSAQEQVNCYLRDEEDKTDLRVNFDSKDSIRNYRIVLAIMQKYKGELHLPFFSKVNLRKHVRGLQNMGFKVELVTIDPKRKVFYSFHHNDSELAGQVRDMGKLDEKNYTYGNKWEIEGNDFDIYSKRKEIKDRRLRDIEEWIKKWIENQMEDKPCMVVLIGEHTASCKWLKYEIKTAWNNGKSVVGIYIHNLTGNDKKQASKIKNPFEEIVSANKHKSPLSDIVKCYNEKKMVIKMYAILSRVICLSGLKKL